MQTRRCSAPTALTLVVAAAMLLSGCSSLGGTPLNEPSSQSSERPSSALKDTPHESQEQPDEQPVEQTPKSDAEPATTPKSPELVIPADCDAMNATAFAEAAEAHANRGVTAPVDNTDMASFEQFAGQVARDTAGLANRYTACYYPVHLHNAVIQYVFEIAPGDQRALIEALRADVSITEKSSGNMLNFAFSQATEGWGGAPAHVNVNYIFAGDAWIAIFDNGELDYSPAAIDGLRAVNPGL